MSAPLVDQLAYALSGVGTRRRLVGVLAAVPLASALGSRFGNGAMAKGRRPRHAQPEIVGGHPVPQGELPFMVYYETGPQDTGVACGGSLVTPRHVLTAAHCTGPDGGHNPPFLTADYFVAIGEVNLDRLGQENIFGVVEVSRHPSWDPDVSQAFDVAVLELDRDVPAGIGTPVAFVGSGDDRFNGAGQPVVVSGWGRTSDGGNSSSVLLEADIAVVSDADCAAAYNRPGEFDPNSMICAGAPGRDSCQGDSGGPLFAQVKVGERIEKIKGKKKKGKKRKVKKVVVPIFENTQIGIVSFGQGCADPDFPGVYAEVSDPAINNFITGAIG
ncbi:MAG: serine protease [Thermomicrobiales bacterium]|nr:serine protease [Thermomicrobiales bacterium]